MPINSTAAIAPLQAPPQGTTVLYKLAQHDVARIDKLRSDGHQGAAASEGDLVPAVVIRVADVEAGACNLQAFIDGNFTLWITSAMEGTEVAQWSHIEEPAPEEPPP